MTNLHDEGGMGWLRRILGWGQKEFHTSSLESHDDDSANVQLAMAGALTFGLHARARRIDLFGHCARVAALCRDLAGRFGVESWDIDLLTTAAQLHEVGMVAIPSVLIEAPRSLDASELRRVRSQALIGAEIVRAIHPAVVGDLIEAQYADLAELDRRFARRSRDYLFAAILRVADVYDTLLYPRPYQQPLERDAAISLLESGVGVTCHPQVVSLLASAQEE